MKIERDDVGRLPGFGGADLTGLGTSAPARPREGVVLVAFPATPRSDRWIFLTLACLTIALLALATYVVANPLEPVVITITSASPPAPAMPAPPDVAHGTATSEPAQERDEPTVARPDEPTAIDQDARPVVPRTHRGAPDRSPTPPQISKPPTKGDVTLECVLDPHLAKCGGGKPSSPPPHGSAAKASDADLPLALGLPEIRAGVAPVKAAAKACGAKHGGKPGEKVRIKLSIAGASGAVISTSAEAPHQATPLGNCVAAALKKASFQRFRKPVIGLVYAITL